MSGFSAQAFRARVAERGPEPDQADWHRHGDYLINPTLRDFVGTIDLKDAAVLIPVVDDGPEARVILTQRIEGLRKHSGQVAFPGGKRDPDDHDAAAAALREAEEEIGLARHFVEIIGRLPDYPTPTGFRVTPVIAIVQPGFSLTPNPEEVDSVFEVPLSFLMEPANHRLESRVWNGVERYYYVMPWQDRKIWGITAGILRTLYERYYA